LYAAAAEQQEQRLMKDPWEEALAGVRGSSTLVDGAHPEERIAAYDLLAYDLNLSAHQLNDGAWKRLRNVMHRLGWKGPKKMRFETETWEPGRRWRVKSSVVKQGYWRSPPGA
jgi:hypothetical protein